MRFLKRLLATLLLVPILCLPTWFFVIIELIETGSVDKAVRKVSDFVES